MRGKNDKLVFGVLTLVVSLVAITIVYAAFSQNLNISGTGTLKSAKWDVHFDTTSYAETANSNVHPATTPTPTSTDLAYTVTLVEPGDKYEFTIDVVNEGTFDANLNAITITATSHPCLRHTVNYNGTNYTATNTNITGVTLPKQSGSTPGKHTVKVTVEYVEPADAGQLPTSDQSFTATVNLGYTQAS
jgi:hypothetical protein